MDRGQWHASLIGHEEFLMALAFSPDGRFLASGSNDGSVRLWDVETCECISVNTGHSFYGVTSVAF
jgi:WD40 repeat protein